jgi:hypothetical protein
MKHSLKLALLVLPFLSVLGGCVVYADDGYRHHHYWHDHDRG